MSRRLFFYLIVSLFFLTGCGKGGPDAGLLSYTSRISTDEINAELLKVTPIKRRSTFGSFSINRATIQPASAGDRVNLMVQFSLTTFEIPEGADGTLAVSSGLRYDPETKQIFLTDLRPGVMRFANASLSEYVSKSTRSAINAIVTKVFKDIPLHQMNSSFKARFIKKVAVYKGDIVIVYGL